MEVLRTREFYIFVKGEYSLWWDRNTGNFAPKTGWSLTDANDPICLGLIDGIIGKIEHSTLFDPRLLLIKESEIVGNLHNSPVYKIKTVIFVPCGSEDLQLDLRSCHKHSPTQNVAKSTQFFDNLQKNVALNKTWGTLKSAGSSIKSTTQNALINTVSSANRKKSDYHRDKERFERQIIEEFHKIFDDTNSFYFSHETDLTNSLQRLYNLEKEHLLDRNALWRTVDDRFFWNKFMLKDLIELNNPLSDPWILPIIQGYIQIEDCCVEFHQSNDNANVCKEFDLFTLGIVSRRSRFRAGTRYKRRGVDEDGNCANYVETEQLIKHQSHELSFVQVRGSIPVYWSQPGYKYRPPPKIDRDENETGVAFGKHFNSELKTYGPICAINLVDQNGREKVVFDAYSNSMLQFDCPLTTYVTFDFHEYCRGMHFENVSILLNAISDLIKEMVYCWQDQQGHICSQSGIFRVNCIDCLDRTNVVQTAIGKAVMGIQFSKLGLITPDGVIPDNIKNVFHLLWANNGDTISKQYAGTNALKGDYTRTGERKFSGLMKDGMNSANRFYQNFFQDTVRQCCLDMMLGSDEIQLELNTFWTKLHTFSCITYELFPPAPYIPHVALQEEFQFAIVFYRLIRYYLNRFKDSTRQGTIDLMLGNHVHDEFFNEARTPPNEVDHEALMTAEHVKLLIEDCKKMLINEPECTLGSWGLINADPHSGDPNETEFDAILILTGDSYFVADYDDQVDKVTNFQKIPLCDVTQLECGLPDGSNYALFKQSIKPKFSIRIWYKMDGITGYYHMFRSTNLRFFNNIAVVIKTEEEQIESLKAICDAFLVAINVNGLSQIPYNCEKPLEKRRSKVVSPHHGRRAINKLYTDIISLPEMTRNVSETQLNAFRNVSTKAFTNMSQQFSKLNKIGHNFKIRKGSLVAPCPPATQIEDNISIEQATEAIDLICTDPHEFLPNVGIIMTQNSDHDEDDLAKTANATGLTPEIQINFDAVSAGADPNKKQLNLKLIETKFSHSTDEMMLGGGDSGISALYQNKPRSASDYDIAGQSQNENAMKKKLLTNLTSPVASVTKDLVFMPFTKLAKGVQTLGANLDPRKLGHIRQIRDVEEQRKLQEKWQNSKCRLIAL